MKIETSTQEIARIVGQLKRLAVPPAATLPVLKGVAITTYGGAALVQATDLDVWASVQIDGRVEGEDGEGCIVGAAALARLLRALGPVAEKVTLKTGASLAHGDSGLQVKSSSVDARLRQIAESMDEWPKAPEMEWWGELPYEAIRRALGKTMPFASTDAARPILNGVSLQMDGKVLRACGTNGHVLGALDVPCRCPKLEAIIVPEATRAVLELMKGSDFVEVGFREDADKTDVAFRNGHATVYGAGVVGTYPNYDQVIPSRDDMKTFVTFRKKELMRALRVCMALWPRDSNSATYRTTITVEDDGVTLDSYSVDVGEIAERVPVVDVEGEPVRIGMNANYLLKVLRYTAGDVVEMAIRSPERAVTVMAPEDEGWTGLAMPLRLLEDEDFELKARAPEPDREPVPA